MKCLILCAGYGTRMGDLTKNYPKPLLKVNNKSIIDYTINNLEKNNIEWYIITNDKFKDYFKNYKNVISDKTTSADNKLGAIGDIYYFIKQQHLSDDLMIVAGDNIFDFDFKDFINSFNGKNSLLMYKKQSENLEKTATAQIVNDIVFILREKEKFTNLAVPPIYILTKKDLEKLIRYVDNSCYTKNNTDSLGYFMSWLVSETVVKAIKMQGNRYDMGNIEIYNKYKDKF